MAKEKDPRRPHRSEPLHPTPLLPEIADFLRDQPSHGCLTAATDQGTAYLIKAPDHEIESARALVPWQVRHELFEHPQAPVIRTVISIYDVPDQPLQFETFCNIDDPSLRDQFAALATQDELLFFFYDEGLTHRLSKGMANNLKPSIPQILRKAHALKALIPVADYDFASAKAAVMEEMPL